MIGKEETTNTSKKDYLNDLLEKGIIEEKEVANWKNQVNDELWLQYEGSLYATACANIFSSNVEFIEVWERIIERAEKAEDEKVYLLAQGELYDAIQSATPEVRKSLKLRDYLIWVREEREWLLRICHELKKKNDQLNEML